MFLFLIRHFRIRITTKMEVVRWRNRPKSHDGYLLNDEEYRQWLVLEKHYIWRGRTILVREIDREDVPTWAWIQRATLGSTDWQSRFTKFIH